MSLESTGPLMVKLLPFILETVLTMYAPVEVPFPATDDSFALHKMITLTTLIRSLLSPAVILSYREEEALV